jgi:hypothetical protein
MGFKKKLASSFVAVGGAAVLMIGSVVPAFAGADLGTVGASSTYFPTASPYISYAKVTVCHSLAGSPNAALGYQGKATLGSNASALGPLLVPTDGVDSQVTLRLTATYTSGDWFCLKKW